MYDDFPHRTFDNLDLSHFNHSKIDLENQDLLQKTWQLYKRSKLLKSSTWYMFSTFFERGLAFIGVLIFTRLLTKEEYGTVSLFLSWFSIFAATITLNSTAAIQLAKHDFDENDYSSFVASSTILGLLAGVVALVILFELPISFIDQVFNLNKVYVVLAALAVILESPWKSVLLVWRVEYQYKRYALTSILITTSKLSISVLLILLPVFLDDKAAARIYGIVFVSLLAGIYFLRWILLYSSNIVNWRMWRYTLSYSLPLIPHALTGFILSHFDRILIDRYIGREETGLYTFAYQLGEIVYMVWYASNTAWVPWFYEQMKRENYELINKRSTQYLLVFTLIVSLVILCAPLLVIIFASEEYRAAGIAVPIVMSGLFFYLPYSLHANIQFYRKRTFFISLGTALAACINLLLNVWLLPEIGYIGAAWSTLVAYIFLYIFHMVIVRYILKSQVHLNETLMFILGVGVTLLSLLVYILMSADV